MGVIDGFQRGRIKTIRRLQIMYVSYSAGKLFILTGVKYNYFTIWEILCLDVT
jgi:hypothetical protein